MARFDLNLLGALDALLTERNVTRAAQRLGVTQPTMSGMLQRLRHQFDDQILVRNGRGMELTHFGLALIEPVNEALKGVKSLMRAELTFDPATSHRTFTIMASDYCTSIFMPRVVAHLAKIAPGLRLVMQSMNAPVERMLTGEVDLCVTTDDLSLLCNDTSEEKLQGEHLFSDEFVCVVANDHPLDDGATMEEYLSFPHVGVQMAGVLNSIESVSIRPHAPHYEPTYTVGDFSLVACMVARTNLVGVIQKRLAHVAAHTLPIKWFAPPFAIPDINETMLWHSRNQEDPAHLWLREALIDEVAAWLEETRSYESNPAASSPAPCRPSGETLHTVG